MITDFSFMLGLNVHELSSLAIAFALFYVCLPIPRYAIAFSTRRRKSITYASMSRRAATNSSSDATTFYKGGVEGSISYTITSNSKELSITGDLSSHNRSQVSWRKCSSYACREVLRSKARSYALRTPRFTNVCLSSFKVSIPT